jgi:hypothetical protein
MKPVEGGLARTKVGSNSGDKMEMFLYWIIILIFSAMKFKRWMNISLKVLKAAPCP